MKPAVYTILLQTDAWEYISVTEYRGYISLHSPFYVPAKQISGHMPQMGYDTKTD
jgi:hypothetical protein